MGLISDIKEKVKRKKELSETLKKISIATDDEIRKILYSITNNTLSTNIIINNILKRYTPTLEDVKNNPFLMDFYDISNVIRTQVNDSNFETYSDYLPLKVVDDLVLGKKITPSREVLDRHEELKKSFAYIRKLIEQGEEDLYIYSGDEYIVDEAIKKGKFSPTIEDLEKYPNLCEMKSVILYLMNKNYDIEKIMELSKTYAEVYSLAIEKGYVPSLEKLKSNTVLATSGVLINYLIERATNPEELEEIIKLYRGPDGKVVDFAIKKGYVPKKDDIKKYHSTFSKSDEFFLKIMDKKNKDIICYYMGKNEKVFQMAFDLGYKVNIEDIKKFNNLLNSLEICKRAIDIKPEIIMDIFSYDMNIFVLALDYLFDKQYINPENNEKLLEIINKNIKYKEIYIKHFPNKVEDYQDDFGYLNLLNVAVNNGYGITLERFQKLTGYAYHIVRASIIERHPEYIASLNEISEEEITTIVKLLDEGKLVLTEEKLEKYPSIIFSYPSFMAALCSIKLDYIKYSTIPSYKIYDFYLRCVEREIYPELQNLTNIEYSVAEKYFDHDHSNFEKCYILLNGIDTNEKKLKLLYHALDVGYVPINEPERYAPTYELLYKMYLVNKDVYNYLSDQSKYMIDILEDKIDIIEIDKLDEYKASAFADLFCKMVIKNPNLIDYYKGDNSLVYKTAALHGLSRKKLIAILLFSNKINLNEEELRDILENAYVPKNYNINSCRVDLDQIIKLESIEPGLIDYLAEGKYISNEVKVVLDFILGKETNISFDLYLNNSNYVASDVFMTKAVKVNPDFIQYYIGSSFEPYKIAFQSGVPKETLLCKISYPITSPEIINGVVELFNIDALKGKGNAIYERIKTDMVDFISLIEVLKAYPEFIDHISPSDKGFIQILNGEFETQNIFEYTSWHSINDNAFYEYLNITPYALVAYYGNNPEVFKKAIELGLPIDVLVNILLRCSDKNTVLNILNLLGIDIPPKYLYYLDSYKNNKYNFIKNYDIYIRFMQKANVNIDKFEQYVFGQNYDFINDMIVVESDMGNFLAVKDFFFNNYYNVSENDTQLTIMNSFKNILKNYVKYKYLCLDILQKGLTDKDVKHLQLLFGKDTKIEFQNGIPTKKEDLDNIEETILEGYNLELESLMNCETDVLKNLLCKVLFDKEYFELEYFIQTYGTTADIKQLVFNNKNNKGLENLAYPIMIYISIIESIIDLSDKETIINIIRNALENLKLNNEIIIIFRKIEDSIRVLFEEDINCNLTDINRMVNKEKYINIELSNEYGVPVYDFSKTDYCLLTHAKSSREDIDDLVNGNAPEGMNNICLSAVSYRNQIYYYQGVDIIFAYGSIPKNSFCQSSIYNMGSNSFLKKNSIEVDQIHRTQRGILETSESRHNTNNEVLCFRENTKPQGIILIGGRPPTTYEQEIATKFNLPFIITQEYGKEISSPEHIEMIPYKIFEDKRKSEELTAFRDKISEYKKHHKRQIAIFTDLHGLFEPGLAILEDARKRGITEIYSLGDNVGTGPNPKEVLDLLREYGVVSLKGNHEGYALDLSGFVEHLQKTGSLEEAQNNSLFTKGQLAEEDLEYIANLKEEIELELGGKKVLLTHHTEDYNTGMGKYDLSKYDEVFQGHVHFEGQIGNVTTLRGAAIGFDAGEYDELRASYIILTETDDGYTVEKIEVPYNYRETHYNVQTSDLNETEKNKIERWGHLR